MKLCWIKAGGFVPLDFGGRIRSFQMVKELARRHEVTVLTFYPAVENDPHQSIAPLFEELITVPLRLPTKGSVTEYADYVRLFTAAHPYSMQKYYRPELRRAVAELFSRKSFDAIICDFVYPAGVLDWSTKTPIILFTHNVESEVWERQYRISTNPIRKLMFWIEYRRLTRAERYYAKRCAHVCAVSEANRRFFGRYVGGAENVTLLPTGVDTEYFQPSPEPPKERTLVFTGSMDWAPNQDAFEYFYQEILPLIRAEGPEVETWIVGRNPSAAQRKLAKNDPKVHLTGRVDDVRPYMHQGSLYILPMRSGSGTRLKVFEAMASGKAIVSTPVGAEGLPVTDGENIVLANDAAKFAEAVIRLIRDPAMRQRLEKNARALAENGLSWRAATHHLENAILKTVGERAKTR
jgi:sugar transferase (PEP-CTERM/EpsH1 system associated)